MASYPGGKNGAGTFQTIINQMPPHRVYIEAFAGSGAILRNKRPARESIAIDADGVLCSELLASLDLPGLRCIHGDALAFLRCYPFQGDELVYCDPPYLMSVRSAGRAIYRHEFATEAQHLELLSLLLTLPAAIAISGYASRMYYDLLRDWRRITFPSVTRGGRVAEEVLWMNYPEPVALHDYRYLGRNFRERERIKRKTARWTARLRTMPATERYAMLAALEKVDDTANSDDAGPRAPILTMPPALSPFLTMAAALAKTSEGSSSAVRVSSDDAGPAPATIAGIGDSVSHREIRRCDQVSQRTLRRDRP